MPASAAPNSRRTGSCSLCSLRISLTLLGGHTLEKIWRGRPCRVCSHFEPKKSAKLELRTAKAKAKRRAAARARRIATKDIMESLGLKRVKVDGKTWYE